MDDLRKRGVLMLWEEGLSAAHVDEWRDRFGAEGEPQCSNSPARRGVRHRRHAIRYWIVPPRS